MNFLFNKRSNNLVALFFLIFILILIAIIVSPIIYKTQNQAHAQTTAITNFFVTVCPHGLGNCGDNTAPSFGGNTSPKHPIRNITLTFLNESSTFV